ncbi:hypothetical protein SLE2022_136410 [Rubroshorea leprosula]
MFSSLVYVSNNLNVEMAEAEKEIPVNEASGSFLAFKFKPGCPTTPSCTSSLSNNLNFRIVKTSNWFYLLSWSLIWIYYIFSSCNEKSKHRTTGATSATRNLGIVLSTPS